MLNNTKNQEHKNDDDDYSSDNFLPQNERNKSQEKRVTSVSENELEGLDPDQTGQLLGEEQPVDTSSEEQTLDSSEPERKKKRSLKQKLIYAAVAIVFCVGLAALLMVVRGKKSKTVNLPETATSQPARDGKKVVDDIYQPPLMPPTGGGDSLPNPNPALAAAVSNPTGSTQPPILATGNQPGKTGKFGETTLSDPKALVTEIKSPPPAADAGLNKGKGNGGSNDSNNGGNEHASNGRGGSSTARNGSARVSSASDQSETSVARTQTADLKSDYGESNQASYVFKPVNSAPPTTFVHHSNSIASIAPASVARSNAFESGIKQIPFGTLLPVRTLGAIHTLFKGSLARLELTRTIKGEGWYLPARTVIVARAGQSVGDRVFLQPIGLIYEDQLYPLSGEFTGTDGAAGLAGMRKQVGSDWYRTLFNIADQANKTLGSWLASRGGGAITSIQLPSVSGQVDPSRSRVVRYVFVPGGTEGYLMSTVLPEKSELGILPKDDENTAANDFDVDGSDLLEKALADPQSLNQPNQ